MQVAVERELRPCARSPAHLHSDVIWQILLIAAWLLFQEVPTWIKFCFEIPRCSCALFDPGPFPQGPPLCGSVGWGSAQIPSSWGASPGPSSKEGGKRGLSATAGRTGLRAGLAGCGVGLSSGKDLDSWAFMGLQRRHSWAPGRPSALLYL